MKHVVMFSGGAGSWLTAKRVAKAYGTHDLILLFADTKMEDPDLYRFLNEAAANVGGELVSVSDGRNPWEVFKDVRFIGNTRIDPCSRVLKRELLRRWLEENCTPEKTVAYIGISWDEIHRFEKAKRHWEPWAVAAPLCDPPLPPSGRTALFALMRVEGIEPPTLYKLGFPHNNCGGFCIKAGQAHFELLLRTMPERYSWHEEKEEEMRQYLGKDVAILRDRRGGTTKPMTLRRFRERIQKDAGLFDEHEWGGCGCFSPDEYEGRALSTGDAQIG